MGAGREHWRSEYVLADIALKCPLYGGETGKWRREPVGGIGDIGEKGSRHYVAHEDKRIRAENCPKCEEARRKTGT